MVKGDGIPSELDRPVPKLADNVMDMFSLKGKYCAVAGAGSGIGLGAVRAFLDAGAAGVAMTYNSNDATIQLAKDLEKEYNGKSKVIALKCPVGESKAVAETVAAIHKEFGRLDVFVANAGMGAGGAITEMSDEYFDKTTAVNFSGVFYCAREAGKIFKQQGSGSFIITASMSASIVNIPNTQALYNAHKAGVKHLGKSLAFEWKDFARCNIVSPGFFYTDMGASPSVAATARSMAVLGRQGDVRELKGIYLYLASDASTFTTGSEIIVDGGYTLP